MEKQRIPACRQAGREGQRKNNLYKFTPLEIGPRKHSATVPYGSCLFVGGTFTVLTALYYDNIKHL